MAGTAVLGSGHDALVAAILLARAGRRVIVLEPRELAGGLAAGEAFAEGWTHRGVLHHTARLRPTVAASLQLEQHGLRWGATPPVVVPDPDGAVVVGEGISGSPDAEAFARWQAWLAPLRPLVDDVLGRPALRIDAGADMWAVARTALKVRRLGDKRMMELLRVGATSAEDWLGEWFTDPRLVAALCNTALVGAWVGPRAPTTSALVMLWALTSGPREVEGGPAALTAVLLAAAAAAGVELRTGAVPVRVVLRGGRVSGVSLADGEVLEVDTVVSGLDPRRTLLDLVEPLSCPPAVERDASAIRCRGAHAKIHLGLSVMPTFHGAPTDVRHVCTARSPVDLERAFDAPKYGILPEAPPLDVRVWPTDAGAVLSAVAHGVPHGLRAGWDDGARQALGDRVLEVLEATAPGISSTVVAREVLCPATLEARYGLTGGHLYGGELAVDQLWMGRPSPALAQHRTPIEGLFLCAGTHPGFGITGGSGELAAAAVLAR